MRTGGTRRYRATLFDVSSHISATKVALLLPGRRYSVNHPVMYYAAAAARELGWTIEPVDWGTGDLSDADVIGRGLEALQGLPSQGSVVIGKSLGSLLFREVADRGIPAVWLTPLLTYEPVRTAISFSTAPTLLIGGTADELWDSNVAHASGHQVLELAGADHRLEVPMDAVASAGLLVTLTGRIREFLEPLTEAHQSEPPSGTAPLQAT